ncbi:hypothetical protein BN14_06134 [Rhizoctonia solani AG-1 IB]|uniref:Uncharacterized protein n=1 Tax=Thanatephorus cucumeris (strain AG1-IB / isolate 7/3/14) TaxID=1108050 RepID=M5BY26_THACB|nr:hypothetical protein BN14_06134 [Rhizoctonia solani AG-1 IB]
MGWKSMVRHYSSQKSTWLERSQRSSVRSAQDFVYLFTHDTKVENAKPLVRILSKSDISASSHYSYSPGSQCLVCNSVGLIESYPEANMKDHLRDVHSIEEPEKGKHYS